MASVAWCPAKQANPYIPVQRKQVTRGFIFVFIYIELSQIIDNPEDRDWKRKLEI